MNEHTAFWVERDAAYGFRHVWGVRAAYEEWSKFIRCIIFMQSDAGDS